MEMVIRVASVAVWLRRNAKLLYARPAVSTAMGDRSGVQLPVQKIYLSI